MSGEILCRSHYNAIRSLSHPLLSNHNAVPSGGSGYCACHCRERGAQRRPRAPQALLQSLDTASLLQIPMAVTHRTAGGPAATTRAAVPSGGSGSCACHCRERGAQRRPRAPQALLQSLDTALLCIKPNGSNAQNRREPSGDHARRSPFWRLWVLRLPLQRARGQRRPRAPQALLEALGTAPATAESEGPSGDHARRRPFCSL